MRHHWCIHESSIGMPKKPTDTFGITDVFDFDNEIKASVMETGDSVKEKLIEKGFDREVNWQNVQEFARGFLRRPINRS